MSFVCGPLIKLKLLPLCIIKKCYKCINDESNRFACQPLCYGCLGFNQCKFSFVRKSANEVVHSLARRCSSNLGARTCEGYPLLGFSSHLIYRDGCYFEVIILCIYVSYQ